MRGSSGVARLRLRRCTPIHSASAGTALGRAASASDPGSCSAPKAHVTTVCQAAQNLSAQPEGWLSGTVSQAGAAEGRWQQRGVVPDKTLTL